ncbi:MAG: CHAT domain-containing protein, partial [Pseudomonadota bacterium]
SGGRSAAGDVRSVAELCPLPDTRYEVGCIAQMLGAPRSSIQAGLDAREANVHRSNTSGQLADAKVVHFATHGLLAGESAQLSKAVNEPALVLTPPSALARTPASDGAPQALPDGFKEDGLLTASEVATLRLDADWVVLSACNTAAGEGGGEALSGLARAFLYAGARSLLVSHWPVNTVAAVLATTRALGHIRADATVGKAQALRRAMLSMLDDAAAPDASAPALAQAHPNFWAPFVVVGEGGVSG